MAISTNGTIITRLAGALYNEYLSNASYTELNTTAAATVAANMLSSDFAGKTDAQIATTVLTNLGLSSVAGLNNWVAAQLTSAGSTATAKGAKLVSMLNDFAMMTADATYGSYAKTFNDNTAAGCRTFRGGACWVARESTHLSTCPASPLVGLKQGPGSKPQFF